MNFKDQWATNEAGEKFIFTVEMQRALHDQGLPVEPASIGDIVNTQRPTKTTHKQDRGHEHSSQTSDIKMPATIQIDPETGKYVGRVKWFSDERAYGFIMRGGGEDIFFHKSELSDESTTLTEGLWVLYDVEEMEKGLEACDIEPYDGQLMIEEE